MAVDGTVQQAPDGGHFPFPTDQIRLNTPERPVLAHTQQPTGGRRFTGTLDADHLRFT
jgi:hypothetical protein